MDYQQKQSPAFSKSSDSKVSKKYIHDDVAFYVLSKLPIKSLKRFGCVRKSWSSLFDDSHFMTVFRSHFISRHNSDDHHHTFLLIYQPDCDDHYHPELHLLDSRIKLNLPPPFSEHDHSLSILGKTSVNGIFCIGQLLIGGNKVRYVLWNPATNEFVNIPPSPNEVMSKHPLLSVFHKFHGFGYDQLRDDYKVIQYVSFDSSSCVGYDLDSPPPQGNTFTGDELYTNGACHWLVKGKIHDTIALMSFDLSHEVFFTTPIGEISDFNYGHLAVLNGSIAYIINHDNNDIFHISILGELGVKESWIKLFIFGPVPSIDWPLIGFGNKGYIFFRKKDDELAYVDLSTQIIEELGVKGEDCCCKIGIYKESLLSIRGSSN
ncbi:F-box/kelch-repeat protein At3g06240-like [Vicia villosa]|uniref:F-box/kelch-repeat protein At3g06240-like n=1 Tax=Vicia villosa TaxID=3911 RepID=UPI00273CA8BE|nr:F-box/kelch-repeat protein At3g06240-like [Vicia villosa]